MLRSVSSPEPTVCRIWYILPDSFNVSRQSSIVLLRKTAKTPQLHPNSLVLMQGVESKCDALRHS